MQHYRPAEMEINQNADELNGLVAPWRLPTNRAFENEPKDLRLLKLRDFIFLLAEMNSLRIPTIPISNPTAVMQMIESSSHGDGLSALLSATAPPTAPATSPKLKLHTNSDAETNSLQLPDLHQPPTEQVKQLVNYLHIRQKELSQREADLQAETHHWEQQVRTSKSHLRKRATELEQHLSQVKLHQAQLLKLQQSLIDSQHALRAVIERIVDDCEPAKLKLELAALRSELDGRFDSILDRWNRVAKLLVTQE